MSRTAEPDAPASEAKRRANGFALCIAHGEAVSPENTLHVLVESHVSEKDVGHFEAIVCSGVPCQECERPVRNGDVIARQGDYGFAHVGCVAPKDRHKFVLCYCHKKKHSMCDLLWVDIDDRRSWLCPAWKCMHCNTDFVVADTVARIGKHLCHQSCLEACVTCDRLVAESASKNVTCCQRCLLKCVDCDEDITGLDARVPCQDNQWRCTRCSKKDGVTPVLWVECGNADCRGKHCHAWFGSVWREDGVKRVKAAICDNATCWKCSSRVRAPQTNLDGNPRVLFGHNYCGFHECDPPQCYDCCAYFCNENKLQRHPVEGVKMCKECFAKHPVWDSDVDDDD